MCVCVFVLCVYCVCVHLQATGQHKNKAGLTHCPVYYPCASTYMVNTQLLCVQNVGACTSIPTCLSSQVDVNSLFDAPRSTPGTGYRTTLCGTTLHPPEVKSCRIIWCIDQREHIVEYRDLLGFKCFQRLLSMQFKYRIRAFEHFIFCAFYKDTLHFLNPNTALKNKINN